MNNPVIVIFSVLLIALEIAVLYFMMVARKMGVSMGKSVLALTIDRTFLIVCAVGFALALFLLGYGTWLDHGFNIRIVMNALMMGMLVPIGWTDWKEHKIPNKMVMVGIVIWLVLCCIELFVVRQSLHSLFLYSGTGLIVPFIMWIIALVSNGKMGMGDVKLYAVLGLLYGFRGVYAILFMSSLIMAVLAIVLLARKKADAKTVLPMAPFTTIGFFICMILGI